MKAFLRTLGTVALAAVIALAVTALTMTLLVGCDNGDSHTHSFGSAWKSNDTQHWKECSCGEKSEVANHDWEWVETTPATLSGDPLVETQGTETKTCSVCGATGETRNFSFQRYFYGTWKNMTGTFSPYDITISDSIFHLIDRLENYKRFDSLTWTASLYPTNSTDMSVEYPNGYTLSGILSHQSYSATEIYAALNKDDKTKMLINFNPSSSSASQLVFDKQEEE
jgi:hypothetical protein